jgi:hypothetical protein
LLDLAVSRSSFRLSGRKVFFREATLDHVPRSSGKHGVASILSHSRKIEGWYAHEKYKQAF